MEKIYLDLAKIRDLEFCFKQNDYHGDINLPSHSFYCKDRTSHIMIGAPHTVKTSTRKLETRDIISAILLSKEDPDDKLADIIIENHSIDELSKLKKIVFDGTRLSILDIAQMHDINPHLLRYYFNKTALEEEKEQELYTGAVSLLVGELVGCHVMVRNNYNDVTASQKYFNPMLVDYIKENNISYYVDIHGAADSSKFDIAPGTNNGEYIKHNSRYMDILQEAFRRFGITNIVFNTKLQASNRHALCNQVWKNCRIDTTQLEINRRLRDPIRDINKTSMLVNGLATYVELLESDKRDNYDQVHRY